MKNINPESVREFAKKYGAWCVWRTWRDTMLKQNREVADKFMQLPIPERDMKLDAQIAADVVKDYFIWRKIECDLPDEDALQAERDLLQKQLDVAMKALENAKWVLKGSTTQEALADLYDYINNKLAEIAKLGEKK